jgi:hypothetical protein
MSQPVMSLQVDPQLLYISPGDSPTSDSSQETASDPSQGTTGLVFQGTRRDASQETPSNASHAARQVRCIYTARKVDI